MSLAKVFKEPCDTPYGMREFQVQDYDGYVLCFGESQR